MENVPTCELCLEQIIKTEDFDHLNCDEKENLKILKNLEITVSRNAKICPNCVNVSHVTYNFKTSCLTNNDHLKTLIHPGVNKKLILEEVIAKKTKSEVKNEEKVCRFCLNFFEVNSLVEVNLEQDVVLKDMLGRCLPKLDTNIVQNPLICYVCNELLEKLFNFISRCEDTEILRNLDTKSDVNKNLSTVTVENNDYNIEKIFVKEEHCESLEDPELQIKSEDIEIDEHIKDSINESNCLLKEGEIHAKPSSFSSGLTNQQAHSKIRKSTIDESFKCTECLFQFKHQSSLVKHKINFEGSYKCNVCGFTASTKCEIVQHKKKSHEVKKGLGNVRNQACQKSSLKLHQNLAEIQMFKCHNCPFVTKWKQNLVLHNTRWHEDMSKLLKYKCDECPYETLSNWQLVNHKVKHKDPSEVKMYKCMECSYESKRKRSVQRHEKNHARNRLSAVKVEQGLSNPVEENDVKPKQHDTINEKKFVCDICSYQAISNYLLKRHYSVHKESSEVNVFKCKYCPFATKWKNNLTQHTKFHKNPSELVKFKCKGFSINSLSNPVEENDVKPKQYDTINEKKFVCDICSYQAISNYLLKRHYSVHKESSEVNLFKCKYCPFATKWKNNVTRHTKFHENPSELVKFKCKDCQYKTIRKSQLVRHLLVHKKPSEVIMYKCKVCPYQAKHRSNIKKHEKMHQVEIYTCDECNYKTKLKRSFVLHLRYHKECKQPAKSNQNPKKKKGI